MKQIIFLPVESILKIHVVLVNKYGGLHGVRDAKLLDSAINLPIMVHQYHEDKNDDIYYLAATYMYAITKNHPFVDGNKRTGLESALSFMRINDLTYKFKIEELYSLSLDTASSSIDTYGIAHFFEKNNQK